MEHKEQESVLNNKEKKKDKTQRTIRNKAISKKNKGKQASKKGTKVKHEDLERESNIKRRARGKHEEQ